MCADCRAAWNANVLRLRAIDPEKRLRQRMASERGMTVERYGELEGVQDGRCAICGKVPERLVIDHDHRCCPDGHKRCGGCNRSLLCDHCNRGLGHFLDDPALLGAAIEYLKGWADGSGC